MQGMLQVYTGNGKGKTTAAIGLAIRAAGAGFKVFIGQFIKGMTYSELNA
ncbi:MAG: cob(I)alamin adenosyltransferase [Halanaerobiales bacterium]|nr:cob(I)alamin adenosyltransferase [Halanaerobiales bacterium]